jgi:8-oxo-dGTP pyrophosphatase MutT (NUDIX family)
VFLIEHPKLGRWLQPGGHIEPSDRSIAGAAVREAEEETGFRLHAADAIPVAISVHRIPAWKGEPSHLHLDLQFLFRVAARAERAEPELGGRWFDLSAPEIDGALEHTRGIVEALLERI